MLVLVVLWIDSCLWVSHARWSDCRCTFRVSSASSSRSHFDFPLLHEANNEADQGRPCSSPSFTGGHRGDAG